MYGVAMLENIEAEMKDEEKDERKLIYRDVYINIITPITTTYKCSMFGILNSIIRFVVACSGTAYKNLQPVYSQALYS